MLKLDVIKYLGYENDHTRGEKKISSLLGISQNAVIGWDDLVPRRRASILHDIFRAKKDVSEDTPTYVETLYEEIEEDRKTERELRILKQLKAKYEV